NARYYNRVGEELRLESGRRDGRNSWYAGVGTGWNVTDRFSLGVHYDYFRAKSGDLRDPDTGVTFDGPKRSTALLSLTGEYAFWPPAGSADPAAQFVAAEPAVAVDVDAAELPGEHFVGGRLAAADESVAVGVQGLEVHAVLARQHRGGFERADDHLLPAGLAEGGHAGLALAAVRPRGRLVGCRQRRGLYLGEGGRGCQQHGERGDW